MALLNEKLGCPNFHLFEINNNTQIFLPLLLKPCTYYCTMYMRTCNAESQKSFEEGSNFKEDDSALNL